MVISPTITVTVVAAKIPTTLEIWTTDFNTGSPVSEVPIDTKININVKLTETATGNPVAFQTVRVEEMKPDGTLLPYKLIYTDSLGQAATSLLLNMAGNYNFWATFAGDDTYEGCEKKS